jgi:hypothetical protein
VTDQRVHEEARVRQTQRIEQQVLHRGLVRQPGHYLDDAPGQVHRRIVVGKHLAQLRELRKLPHARDVFCERVLASSEVRIVVAHPAGAVVEKLAHRDSRRYGFIGKFQLR